MTDSPPTMSAPSGTVMSPAPTSEEAAAIMAAHEALWPRPAVPMDDQGPRNTSWRFSSRWWAQPVPVRRQRPWR